MSGSSSAIAGAYVCADLAVLRAICNRSGMHEAHPVGLTLTDDLRRSRLTVFFRLILVIPHFIWLIIWSIGTFVAAIAGWLITLITGQLPGGLHRFFCAYIRYVTHVFAYLYLVANPYPAFNGSADTGYPLELTLPDPAPQRRLLVLVRIVLAIPAIVISSVLTGGGGSFAFKSGRKGNSGSAGGNFSGMAAVAALLGWFASVVQGRMPKGLRDTGAFGLGYRAQALAYLLLVTERYPNSDPHALLSGVEPPPLHPVRLEGDSLDLRRSRVTVFFRLPLLIPHLVWLTLWGIVAVIVLILQWFVTLFAGRPATVFHRFLSAYIRYAFHVYAFGSLAANPFPGFTGKPGVYPLDLVLPEPARQNRWKTLFRGFLAFPALIISGALWGVVFVAAILTWFTALFTGQAPEGLRNVTAWALRYTGQTNAYFNLITDAYPNSSPLEGAEREPVAVAEPETEQAA
jgi:hypothetical protein